MSAKKLTLGKPIEMCIVETDDITNIEQAEHDYVSKIMEYVDNRILVELPIRFGRLMRVKSGDLIHILGLYDGDYSSVYTRVTDIIQNKIPILVLEPISEIKRVQRRGLYRHSILKNIKYKVINDDISAEYPACMTDISGNGAGITIEQDLSEGSSILLQMDLDGEIIEVEGNIIRKEYNEEKNLFMYGIHFDAIERKHQDIIIQYIFKEQAKALKRGIR